MTAGRTHRFGLITPSGWGNLGDAAIQDAVIAHLRRRVPGCEIIAFSLNPEDTEHRHGVPAYPISGLSIIPGYWVRTERTTNERQAAPDISATTIEPAETAESGLKAALRRIPVVFSILRFVRRLLRPLETGLRKGFSDVRHVVRSIVLCRGAQALIVSGGGQIDDYWGGKWGHPYTLFKWALISRLTGSRYIFAGVGTCSLSSSLSRFFVRRALSMADSRSFRDHKSLELARQFGAAESDSVVPDLAFALDVEEYLRVARDDHIQRVIVSPMCYCDPRIWPTKRAEVYEGYLRKLAEVCASLIREGWKVTFVPSDTADNMAIKDCVAFLSEMVSEAAADAICVPRIDSVDDLLRRIVTAQGVIASRLHGVLLSFALHRPVLSLSYDRKVRTLVEEMSQTEYCLEIEQFSVDKALERFKRMGKHSDDVSREIESRVADFRESLNRHFDSIFTV